MFCREGIEKKEQTRRIEVPTPITLRTCNAQIDAQRLDMMKIFRKEESMDQMAHLSEIMISLTKAQTTHIYMSGSKV